MDTTVTRPPIPGVPASGWLDDSRSNGLVGDIRAEGGRSMMTCRTHLLDAPGPRTGRLDDGDHRIILSALRRDNVRRPRS
jgi:hypothetical protein